MKILRALTLACVLIAGLCATAARAQQTTAAQSNAEGQAAAKAENNAVRPALDNAEVKALTDGYTTTPPETALQGRASLREEGQQRMLACSTVSANDPSCQGVTAAFNSANTSRPTEVTSRDPDIVTARSIAASPGSVLGEDLAEFYPGCTRTDVSTGATDEIRSCTRFEGVGAYGCSNTLGVKLERTLSCTPLDWYAHAAYGSTGLEVQCRPDLAAGSTQRFRITSNGGDIGQFVVNMDLAPPAPPNSLGTAGDEWGVPNQIYRVANSCTGDNCSLTVFIGPESRERCSGGGSDGGGACWPEPMFRPSYDACPGGTVGGDAIRRYAADMPLDRGTCFQRAWGDEVPYLGFDMSATIAGEEDLIGLAPAVGRTVTGWELNPYYGPYQPLTLNFTKASATVTEHDTWTNLCPTLSANGRCTVATQPICIDGPSTKMIEGLPVHRACWEYASSMNCSGSQVASECDSLASSGCRLNSSTCAQTNAVSGLCEISHEAYACPVPAGTQSTFTNCPSDVACLGGGCFDKRKVDDPDFAKAISSLEAARQAAAGLDPNTMQVFKGEANSCKDHVAQNCCTTNPDGEGIVDSKYVDGSAYVYTLLTADGFGAFSGSGLTHLLLEGVFGCSTDERMLSLKLGARLCHEVGSWCSSCVRFLGKCVRCIEDTHMKCCFNSVLARVINEQGRLQVGKGWGAPQGPDCSGFTIAQLQTLNFSTMDFSEFYASIISVMPDLAAAQQRNLSRIASCYYGQGQCQ